MSTQSNTDTKSVTDQAKDAAADLAEQTKAAAQTAAEDAKSAAMNRADGAKHRAADEVSGVASALRTAAEEMRSGSAQERTVGQIAESLADASDAIRDKDLGTMVDDVSNFARRNPLVFLGGAALLGFAATRFAKASNKHDYDTAEGSVPAARDVYVPPSGPAYPTRTRGEI